MNTAGVPDGAYGLEVRATDAAGNSRSTAYGQPVVIDNVPDTVVMLPAPTQGAVGGATRVATPSSPASTAPDNGVGASSNATMRAAFAASRRGVVTSRYGKKVLITGQLKRPDGTPIAGAKLHVLHQDKTFGAAMVPAAEITTDATGTFRHVTTADRLWTSCIGYRARHADTEFAETTDIALGVIARVGLDDRPRVAAQRADGEVPRQRRGRTAGVPEGRRAAGAQGQELDDVPLDAPAQWLVQRGLRVHADRREGEVRVPRTCARGGGLPVQHGRVQAGSRDGEGLRPQVRRAPAPVGRRRCDGSRLRRGRAGRVRGGGADAPGGGRARGVPRGRHRRRCWAKVCVVDTGVDLSTDAAPAVVERHSVFGGTTDDVGGSGLAKHGDAGRGVIASQLDGRDSVGIWPEARIVSVRVFAGSGGGATVAGGRLLGHRKMPRARRQRSEHLAGRTRYGHGRGVRRT